LMEEHVFGKMNALSLRLDASNTNGKSLGRPGRVDRARRRRARGTSGVSVENGETHVRLDLGTFEAERAGAGSENGAGRGSGAGAAETAWTLVRRAARASEPWSLEITRANADALRALAFDRAVPWVTPGSSRLPSADFDGSVPSGCSASVLSGRLPTFHNALSNLTSLSLRSGRGIGDAGASQLARALRGAVPRLKALDVSANNLGRKAALALADALCLSESDAECEAGARVAVPGVDASRASPLRTCGCALETLDVSANHIGSEGARALAAALVRGGCPKLRKLDVSQNLIGASGVAAVAELLVAQATRRSAGIATVSSAGEAGFGRSDAFRAHALDELGLRHNGCGDAGASAIAAAMRESARISSSRVVEGVSPRFEAFTTFCGTDTDSTVPIAHSLRILKLGFNGIGPEGAKALAEAISSVRHAARDAAGKSFGPRATASVVVGELDLACNAIGPEGARALGAALDDGVSKLDLGNNGIGCVGAKDLARALVSNSTTTELSLAGNEIKGTGAWWIAAFLAKTKHVSGLTTLDLGSNAVGDAGACDLAEEMTECVSLRHLDLRRNDITRIGAESFCDAMTRHAEEGKMTSPSVCLRGNAVDSACQSAIRSKFGLRIDVEMQVSRAAVRA